MRRNNLIISILFLMCGMALCGCEDKQDEMEIVLAELPEESVQEEFLQPVSEAENCYVHICGAVMYPGVYELPYGSRVFEAVAAAGGFREDACTDYMNQAMLIEDGVQISIPTVEEVQKAEEEGIPLWENTASAAAGQLINLNTATSEMLCTLPGIGQAKAESIIRYREQNGKFICVEDIMKVEGIKEGLFSKLKDKITV